MKKFRLGFIALTAIILIMLSSGTAKAETWEEFLSQTMWQVQNPSPNSLSILWGFYENKKVVITMKDMQSGASQQGTATYKVNGDVLIINDGGTIVSYTLRFTNSNKIMMVQGEAAFILAKVGSNEDTWFNNMLQQSSGYGGYGGYSGGTSSSSYKPCYTCFGVGSCKVCGGSGYYSAYGYGGTCSACSGTGKCWHCHGSGKQ